MLLMTSKIKNKTTIIQFAIVAMASMAIMVSNPIYAEPGNIIIPPIILPPPDFPPDPDPDAKDGGKDPLVFGKWSYTENSADKCKSEHPFDYDNDGFKEDFCYHIVGSIFVVDFGSGIKSGYNMLNFDGTAYDGLSPIGFLEQYPDTCELNDCYLWTDANADWDATPDELEPFSFEIDYVRHFPEGKKLVDNGRYAYCAGESTDGDKFYCLQPTYWMKGR